VAKMKVTSPIQRALTGSIFHNLWTWQEKTSERCPDAINRHLTCSCWRVRAFLFIASATRELFLHFRVWMSGHLFISRDLLWRLPRPILCSALNCVVSGHGSRQVRCGYPDVQKCDKSLAKPGAYSEGARLNPPIKVSWC
jgi:hypothetical protein